MAEIAVVLFLQLMDIRDLTQTLWMTHVMIGLAVLYFIYTICNKFYHHTTTHALWICTIGIIILIGTLFSDMYNYYQGSQDIEIVGRIAMLLFYRNPCLRHRIRIPKGNRYRPSRGSLP